MDFTDTAKVEAAMRDEDINPGGWPWSGRGSDEDISKDALHFSHQMLVRIKQDREAKRLLKEYDIVSDSEEGAAGKEVWEENAPDQDDW
jgi:hypothetical protein